MNLIVEILLPILTILVVFILFLVSVFRVPFTSTKISFAVFGLILSVWNFIEILQRFRLINEESFPLHQIIFSNLTVYMLVIFGLNFPFYRRREVLITIYAAFVGGVGYLITIQTFSIPYINSYFPLESRFYESLNIFLTRAFSIFAILSFIVIVIYKMTHSSNLLKKFLYRSLSYTVVLFIFVLSIDYFLTLDYKILKANINVLLIDILFLSLFVLSLIQFKFIAFYPGILSIFIYKELPRLVIQSIAPSNSKGAIHLKEELWKIYEVENWKKFLNEFWFSIIIDETLDNAVEHGGRRSDDEITVQVYETSSFLDIYVIDSGKGFDPELVPNPASPERINIPTGRGIHIMKKLFQVNWNFLGNEVRVRVSKNPEDNPKEA
ncbi:MAG: ATP-binding protein [Leptospiraceae bacterium]|nr:ATP-binding protein [Leptospiraceae bacterium]